MEQVGELIAQRDAASPHPLTRLDSRQPALEAFLCPVDEAARIIGQKWTLQIVHELMDRPSCRFCELQEALGGVNPSTLSSRLKMLEEEGLVHRVQVSAIPPHVEYSLTPMGAELRDVIAGITRWSNHWLCANQDGICRPAQTTSSVCIDE
jgi:DNA-binding HxlR family transcriptional regulator